MLDIAPNWPVHSDCRPATHTDMRPITPAQKPPKQHQQLPQNSPTDNAPTPGLAEDPGAHEVIYS